MTTVRAPILKDEAERMADLREFELIDSISDPQLDAITLLASQICKTPMALISLVDEHRQWFKSKVGIDINETHRDIAFCAHAINQDEIFVVEDALADHRFKKNPLVVHGPKLRFYAGSQLRTVRGHALGTLCVLDYVPKKLTQNQMTALEVLAKQIVLNFEHRKKESSTQKDLNSAHGKLQASAKMASFGQIASSIAHEIVNFLTIIDLKVEIILKRISEGDLDRTMLLSDLNMIKKTNTRMVKIVRGLGAFSRNSQNDPMEVVEASKVIDDTLSLCVSHFKGSGVRLLTKVEPGIMLECRPPQISQILMNLLNNAFDAVKDSPDPWISIDVSGSGQRVEFKIRDCGKILNTKLTEKMMEPFFTTKEVGKGTGLGLSISKSIAEEHGGQLVYDHAESNTCFTLTLPSVRLQ